MQSTLPITSVISAISRILPFLFRYYAEYIINLFSKHVTRALTKKVSSYFLQNNSHKYATDQRIG